jgi:phage terminase large subunit-like protein
MGRKKTDIREIIKNVPGYDPYRDAGDCYFDAELAQARCNFFPDVLKHVEGELSGQPLEIEPWLQAVVGNLMGWKRPDGSRRYREAFIYVPRKNSKALALNTPIPTPNGWANMGELKVGDILFDERGKQCKVLQAKEIQYGKKCYKVSFSDHTSIIAAEDHLWTTHTRLPHKGKSVKTTKEILNTLRHGINKQLNHRVPETGALNIRKKNMGGVGRTHWKTIHPYVLGMWLGDGSKSSTSIVIGGEDLVETYSNLRNCEAGSKLGKLKKVKRADAYVMCMGLRLRGTPISSSLHSRLRAANLLENKHIPPKYLRASDTDRLELLQGLMDSDGSVSKIGQCFFSNTSRTLIDETVELLRSLGYKPSICESQGRLNGVDKKKYWRIQFWAYQDDPPVFKLTRKLARLKTRPTNLAQSKTRYITSIDEVPSVPVRCIEVDSKSHLFRAGKGMIPTHNSTTVAGIANMLFFTDNEPGAEIFVAAASRDQAGRLFRIQKQQILHEPELASRCKVQRSIILSPDESSFVKCTSAEAGTQHGHNVHAAIIDELHVQPNADLWEAFETGTVSRRQPLMIGITTADIQRESLCTDKYLYACQVRDGLIQDDAFLPVIYEADIDDDWTSPKTWAKANPMLGLSVPYEYMERQVAKAKLSPREENSFRRLHLNIRTEATNRFFSMDTWDKCTSVPLFESAEQSKRKFISEYTKFKDNLEGKLCFGGLDLSANLDLTAFSLVFPMPDKQMHVLSWAWIPRETAIKYERDHNIPYKLWENLGFIEIISGAAIEYDIIRTRINQLAQIYNIHDIGVDKHGAIHLMQDLEKDGIEAVTFHQGFNMMSPPIRELERRVETGQLNHGSNPILRWQAGNADTKSGSEGDVKLMKPAHNSPSKIDSIVATVMGVGRAMLHDAEESKSVYETRGVRSFD